MPLSEHEQKLLDQMERALYAEDPSFATQMKGHPRVTSRSRVLIGVIAGVVGLVIVLLGVNAASIPLGVLGFVIMVAGVVWAATPRRAGTDPDTAAPSVTRLGKRKGKNKRSSSGGSFMGRMDERWEKRRRDGAL